MEKTLDLDWLISVDDHVLEPPNVWQDRVATKFKDRAPRLIQRDGEEYWLYEDRRIDTVGLSAAAGRSKEEFHTQPVPYSEMRRGCYDSVARIEDMDRAGVLASLCFPSLPRFCGQLFWEGSDHELGLACVQAYNDWMIDEWSASAPGRYIPLVILPLWDPKEAAAEIERCAGMGARGLAFSENPEPLGLPSIYDPDRYWDPVFAAANDAEVVVCTHIGSSSSMPATSKGAPHLVSKAWRQGAVPSATMMDWLFCGVFQRFENLKLALSEGGIGWIPFFLQSAEYTLDRHRWWAAKANAYADGADPVGRVVAKQDRQVEVDYDTLDVRELFADHVFGCFIDDVVGIRDIDLIGVDNVMVEMDYPHSDSTWPSTIDVAHKQLQSLSDADIYKILRGNAERIFKFEPAKPPPARSS